MASISRKRGQAAALAAILVVHVTAVTITWRDIRQRPADQIRGSKKFWRSASTVNTLGCVAYWLIGRRWSRP